MKRRLLVSSCLALCVVLGSAGISAAHPANSKHPPKPAGGHWVFKHSRDGSTNSTGGFRVYPAKSHIAKLKLKGGNGDCPAGIVKVLGTPKLVVVNTANGNLPPHYEWVVGTARTDGPGYDPTTAYLRFGSHKKKYAGSLTMTFPHPRGAGSSGTLQWNWDGVNPCYMSFTFKKG